MEQNLDSNRAGIRVCKNRLMWSGGIRKSGGARQKQKSALLPSQQSVNGSTPRGPVWIGQAPQAPGACCKVCARVLATSSDASLRHGTCHDCGHTAPRCDLFSCATVGDAGRASVCAPSLRDVWPWRQRQCASFGPVPAASPAVWPAKGIQRVPRGPLLRFVSPCACVCTASRPRLARRH